MAYQTCSRGRSQGWHVQLQGNSARRVVSIERGPRPGVSGMGHKEGSERSSHQTRLGPLQRPGPGVDRTMLPQNWACMLWDGYWGRRAWQDGCTLALQLDCCWTLRGVAYVSLPVAQAASDNWRMHREHSQLLSLKHQFAHSYVVRMRAWSLGKGRCASCPCPHEGPRMASRCAVAADWTPQTKAQDRSLRLPDLCRYTQNFLRNPHVLIRFRRHSEAPDPQPNLCPPNLLTTLSMEAILPLSTAARLPVPADKPFIPSVPRSDTAEQEEPSSPPLAPYQARPVTGSTIISHNYTPALPVLDADKLDQEVRAGPTSIPASASNVGGVGRWRGARCLGVPTLPPGCRIDPATRPEEFESCRTDDRGL